MIQSILYNNNGTSAIEHSFFIASPAPTVSHAVAPGTLVTTVTGDPASGVGIDLWNDNGDDGVDFVTGCPDSGGEHAFDGPTVSCDFGMLAPGAYFTDAGQQIDGTDSDRQVDYFRIPVAPTLSATAGSATVTLSGTATDGDTVQIFDGATEVCAKVATGGSWSCFLTATAGAHSYTALSQDSGVEFQPAGDSVPVAVAFLGLSARSASVSVTVLAPAVTAKPTATPTPTPTPTPLAYTANFGWDGEELHPGDSTVVTGDGAPAGSLVDVELHSTPVALGSTTAAADGTFSIPVTIPLDIEPGDHHFVIFVTPTGEARAEFEQAVAITALPDAEVDVADDEPAIDDPQPTVATGNRNDLTVPTEFTTSLTTFPELLAEILSNPAVLGGAGLAAIALLLFVGFPAELLNATFSEQYGRFTRGLPGEKGLLGRIKAWFVRTPVLGGIGITFAAAFLFGFVDPSFGFDLASLRTVLACALALFFVGFLSSALTGFIVKRRWAIPNVIELKPLGLILTVVGVVMSRLLDFSPGFLIGLILGLSLAASATVAQEAKAALIRAGIIFVLAVGAWVIYSVVMATGGTDTAAGTFALDVMVATTGEGMTALLIGLLPFRFLDGESVFKHSKVWWAIAWGVSAISFLIIIVPSSWGEINGSLILWVVILGGFGLVALGLYLYFRFWAPKVDEEPEEPRNAETHEVIPR